MKMPVLCSFLLVALLVCPASATIIDHVGQNDPTGEFPAWNSAPDGSQGNVNQFGGQETIGGQTFDFWSVDDNSSNGAFSYTFNPTDTQKRNPWRMTQILRVEDTNASGTGFGIGLLDGMTYWRVNFTEDGVVYQGDGNTQELYTNINTTDTYHRYDLVFTPTTLGVQSPTDQIQLFVDLLPDPVATLTRADVRALANNNGLGWGSGSSGGTGELRWNFVEFSGDTSIPFVPEPSSLALLALGAVGCGWRGRQHR